MQGFYQLKIIYFFNLKTCVIQNIILYLYRTKKLSTMKFGIIDDNMSVRIFGKANNIETFALSYLRFKVREEGLKTDAEGMREYMEGWLELEGDFAIESGDEAPTKFSEIVESIADNITYCNAHLQKLVGRTWIPISSEEKEEFEDVITKKLMSIEQ
jgi:hypothetical protein